MSNYCATKPDTETTGLLWEIDDFNFIRRMTTIKGLGPRQDHLRSKVFSTASGLEFCLVIYPHGTPHTFGHVGMYLHSLSDVFSHVTFSFVLLDKRFNEVPKTKVDHAVHRLPRGSNWGFPRYLTVTNEEDFTNFIGLLGGKLRLKCDVQVYCGVTHGLLRSSPHLPKERKMFEDICDMLTSLEQRKTDKDTALARRLKDFSLVCVGGERVKCSSLVLSSRSKVFCDMLCEDPTLAEYELEEDASVFVVQQFVDFAHFDRCELLETRPIELGDLSALCILAHAFEFEGLMYATVLEVIQNISPETILPISDVAGAIDSKALDTAVTTFFNQSRLIKDIRRGHDFTKQNSVMQSRMFSSRLTGGVSFNQYVSKDTLTRSSQEYGSRF